MFQFFHEGFVGEQFITKMDRSQYNYNKYKIRDKTGDVGYLNIGGSLSFLDFGCLAYRIDETSRYSSISYLITNLATGKEVGQIETLSLNSFLKETFIAKVYIFNEGIYTWKLLAEEFGIKISRFFKFSFSNKYRAQLMNENNEGLTINAKYKSENLNGEILMTSSKNYILLGCGIFLMDKNRRDFGFE